jgi:hypothetical protein
MIAERRARSAVGVAIVPAPMKTISPAHERDSWQVPLPLYEWKPRRALTQGGVFENQTRLGVNNLRQVVHSQVVHSNDDHRAATTDSDTYRYHGQNDSQSSSNDVL